tara:strand:+ start:4099 stop:4251 length:153 start_codon:yes stop_codon:yes gene_type:complete
VQLILLLIIFIFIGCSSHNIAQNSPTVSIKDNKSKVTISTEIKSGIKIKD